MTQSSLTQAALQQLRDQPDQLIEIILQQAAAIQQMRQQIEDLQKQIRDLNDRNSGLSSKVEALEKVAARQAAPFRIPDKDRKTNPQKPGRPKGHPGTYRAIPDQVDQEIVVPLEQCPQCGKSLKGQRAIVQYMEELPVVRPRVTPALSPPSDGAERENHGQSIRVLSVHLRPSGGAGSVRWGESPDEPAREDARPTEQVSGAGAGLRNRSRTLNYGKGMNGRGMVWLAFP